MLTVCCKPVLYVVILCYILDQLLKVGQVKESDVIAVNYCEEKIFIYDKKTLNVFDGKTMKLMTTLVISESMKYNYVHDIVSRSDTMQLFIVGYINDNIWRVDISSIHNMNINMFVRHEDRVLSMSFIRR